MIRFRLALALLFLALLPSTIACAQLAQQDAPGVTQIPADQPKLTDAQFQAITGEFTNPDDPEFRMSFYAAGGKFFIESERGVPAELRIESPLEFKFPRTNATVRFTLDAAGHAESVTVSNEPGTVYRRTGDAVHHVFHDYQRSEVMIPMRDGVKLHAVILKPSDIAAPLPFLIERTPYGVDGTGRPSFFGSRPELARDGYIFVAEDIRGRFKSEGEFIMSRPLADHHDPKAVDESTDTIDTVEWLMKNVRAGHGVEQGRHQRGLRQGQGWIRVLS